MMNLRKNIKTSFALLLCLVVTPAVARDIAVVSELTGNAFSLKSGSTSKLKVGHTITDLTELMTEEASRLTLVDYQDRKFHLAGSGHIKFLNRTIELRSGYLWIQSYNKQQEFSVQTANAETKFVKGEGIISFDPYTGKTQALSITSEFRLFNILEDQLPVVVRSGEFSFVDRESNEGLPRRPTPVGQQSFQKITQLFPGVQALEKGSKKPTMQKKRSRGIASIPSSPKDDIGAADISQGENVIILRRAPAHAQVTPTFDVDAFHAQKVEKITQAMREKRRNADPYKKRSTIPIKIFGIGRPESGQRVPAKENIRRKNPSKKKERKMRSPAIIEARRRKAQAMKRTPASLRLNPQVEIYKRSQDKSVIESYKQKMRHSEETNKLIDELKSIDMDYKKNY